MVLKGRQKVLINGKVTTVDINRSKMSSSTLRYYEQAHEAYLNTRKEAGMRTAYAGSTAATAGARTPSTERAQVQYAKETKKIQQENISKQKEYEKTIQELESQKTQLGTGEYIRQREAADIKAGIRGYKLGDETYRTYGQATAAAARKQQSAELRALQEAGVSKEQIRKEQEARAFRVGLPTWLMPVPKTEVKIEKTNLEPKFTRDFTYDFDLSGQMKTPTFQDRRETVLVINGKKTTIGALEDAGLTVSENSSGGYDLNPRGLPTTIEEAGFTRPGLFLEDLTRAGYADVRAVETEYRIKLAQSSTETEKQRWSDWRERKLKEVTPTATKFITDVLTLKGVTLEETGFKYSKKGDYAGEFLQRLNRLDIPGVDINLTPSQRVGLVGTTLAATAIAAPSFLLSKAPATAGTSQSLRSLAGFSVAGETSKAVYKATGSELASLTGGLLAGSAVSMGPRALYERSPIKLQTAKLPGQKIASVTLFGKPAVTGVLVDKTIGSFRGQFAGVVKGQSQSGLGLYQVTQLGKEISKGVGRVKFGAGTSPVQPLSLPPGGSLPYETTLSSSLAQSKFTTAVMTAAIKKQPSFIPSEISFMQAGLAAGKALQKAPSPRVTVPDFSQVKVLQAPGLQYVSKPYINFLTSQRKDILIKGSLSDYSQASLKVLPKFDAVPVKDIDVATVGYGPEEFFKRVEKTLPKGSARMTGQKLELFDVKEKKFVKVSDVISKEEVGSGYGGGESRLGLVTQQKPVKYKGFVMQRMSEQVGRRLSTMLEVQRRDKQYFFSPIKKGRVFKDTYRFMEINAPSLSEGLRKSINPFDWMKARKADVAVSQMKAARGLDITTPVGFGKSLFFTDGQKAQVSMQAKNANKLSVNIQKAQNKIYKKGQQQAGLKIKEGSGEQFLFGSEEAYYKMYPPRRRGVASVYPYPPQVKSRYPTPTGYKLPGKEYPKIINGYRLPVKGFKYPKAVKPTDYPIISKTPVYPTPSYPKGYPTPSYNVIPYTPTYPTTPYTPTYPVKPYRPGYPTTPTTPTPFILKADIPKRALPAGGIYTEDKKDKQPGYDVYVKRTQAKQGKGSYKSRGFEKANTDPLPRSGAFLLGAELVDKYANRSFTIRKANKPATGSNPQPNKVKYYLGKMRTKKGNKNIFVEKTNYAIDSVEEKLKIPYESMRLRKMGVIPYRRKKQ